MGRGAQSGRRLRTKTKMKMRMKRKRKRKREARVAFIENVAGSTVVIVFRGGWIDAMMARRETDLGGLKGWLGASRYCEELSGISLGSEAAAAIGEEGVREIASWAEGAGWAVVSLPRRSRAQAEAIIEGIRRYKACAQGEGAADRAGGGRGPAGPSRG